MSGAPGDRSDAGQDSWLGLVRSLVHDLRTPIATASGYLELAQLDAAELEPPVSEYLEQTAAALREISSLVTLVGDVARLEAGRRPLTLAPVEPDRLLERVATRRAPYERARMDVTPGAEASPLRCDVELVARSLDAMVHLAFGRSSKQGRVTLAAAKSGDRLRLVVRDQGTPIEEERLPRLFVHRRTAGDSSSAAKLALVHARLVAEAHGGVAGADRREGGGMAFWIELAAGGPAPPE